MKCRTLLCALGTACLLASCGVAKAPVALYSWYGYTDATYSFIKSRSDADRTKLIHTYEAVIAQQQGLRKTVPPGVYADYGYLLIQMGQEAKGKEMLEKEMALYPESKTFVERIVTNLSK